MFKYRIVESFYNANESGYWYPMGEDDYFPLEDAIRLIRDRIRRTVLAAEKDGYSVRVSGHWRGFSQIKIRVLRPDGFIKEDVIIGLDSCGPKFVEVA